MPSITIHVPSTDKPSVNTWANRVSNPLPQLLQTPSGLAILEIQGKINMPVPDPLSPTPGATSIGRLVFPHYRADDPTTDTTWMKTAHLYVGRYQRLTGEVKKLVNPLAVIQRREGREVDDEDEDELEIVDLVYHKIVFSSRPEPVGEGSV
jgi:hypothetical protein